MDPEPAVEVAAESVTLPPAQKVVGPPVIIAVGLAFTVTTVFPEVVEQPFELVTVTE
jgi:hypothetical protein